MINHSNPGPSTDPGLCFVGSVFAPKLARSILIALTLALPAAAQTTDPAGLPVLTGNLTITDAVNTALRYSPTLQASQSQVSAASARVGAAKSMTRLQLSTTTFATKGSMPMILAGPPNVQPQNLIQVPGDERIGQNLMLMYPLYTGGRLSGQVNTAGAIKNAVDWDTASTELDVALAARIAYDTVLLMRSYVHVYQKRVDESSERVRIADAAYKEGRIAKYDLLRNQTDLADSQQKLNDSQKDVEVALADLKNVMGVSQSSTSAVSDELVCRDFGRDLAGLEAVAIKQRPEVAAARARVKSAESLVGVAKSGYRPQIYFTGMQDFATTRRDGFDQGYMLGVSAAIPLLDGNLRRSDVQEARATVSQTKANEREAVLLVARDVAAQTAEFNAETRNVTLSQAAVDQAEEDYRVIKLRYDSGKAINVEVLDALASLTRARTNYADALYRQNVARERLVRAIGEK
jgi:outer membrane protein TolC